MLLALGGMIIAAMTTDLNEATSSILLPNISGGLGIGSDQSSWFGTLYDAAEIIGMVVSPWFAITFSFRRWSLGVIFLTAASSALMPLTNNINIVFILHGLQGLCGGLTIPLLMATALRALAPSIRLIGLACYALTASFFPNLSTAVAAMWSGVGDSTLGWQFAFYEAVPLAMLAAVLVWFGMIQDHVQLQRFKQFNWWGFVLAVCGLGSLAIVLEQGDRLDWFNSQLICILSLCACVCVPLFLLNEWFFKTPFIKLQMLNRRNLAYSLVTLFGFLIVGQAASTVPAMYLEQVQGLLPAQSYIITFGVAASQLFLLPLMVYILDKEPVDARFIALTGKVCLVVACIGSSFLSSVWQPSQFYLWQGFASIGEAMVVMPLLMKATNVVKPEEGPFAAALINTPRAISGAVSVWLINLVQSWRGNLHSTRITEQLGQERFRLIQGHGTLAGGPAPLLPDGTPSSPDSLALLYNTVNQQVSVLTISDLYLVLAGIGFLLILLVFILPTRSYPPRIALLMKK